MITICCQKQLAGKMGKFHLKVDSSFQAGKIHAIFGESGSGKSTILKMLSGILKPDSGVIGFGDEIFFDSAKNINRPVWKRKIGFVFQNHALFPHLNVYQNITFGLDQTLAGRLDEIISMLELQHLLKARVSTLSGGQSQKVALARALLHNPKILLLDEPFSGLDSAHKLQLQEELKRLLAHFRLTTFLVSHDVAEVILLSDFLHHLEEEILKAPIPPKNFFLDRENDNILAKILDIEYKSKGVCLSVLVRNLPLRIYLEGAPEGLRVGDDIILENHLALGSGHRVKKLE